jgi:hypothetical protein
MLVRKAPSGAFLLLNIGMDKSELKPRIWKAGISAPDDARRPRCQAIESLDGKTGRLVEDETDLIDWLIVIAYESEE